jgi:hypothetical protein
VEEEIRHPEIEVQLSGLSGNAGTLMDAVTSAIKEARRRGDLTAEEAAKSIGEFREEAMSGDYTHLLRTCQRWVNVS